MDAINLNLEVVLKEAFLDYAAFVLQRRALPDARDMFKYTARQIIHAQWREKLTHDKPMKKAQKSVAAAMAFSYVHGDAACFGQIVKMGRPLVQRYFFEEIEGNHGTPCKNDDYSAPRYLECRLSSLAGTVLKNIDKGTLSEGDWQWTYDDEGQFPTVFPSIGYYNLCNGAFASIGVGLAASVPQFNLKEVNKVITSLIDDPEAAFTLYPDFASGATLLNPRATLQSLENGRGRSALLRGTVNKNPKGGYLEIVDLPYGVYTDTVCVEIADAIEAGNCPATEFKDLSKTKVNIRVYAKDLEKAEQWLYDNTSVQRHFPINLIMLSKQGRVPKYFTLREALLEHISHTRLMLRNKFLFDLKKLEEREKVLEGLIKAASIVEEIIALVKRSSGRASVVLNLQTELRFSERQAEAIADIKTYRWSNFDVKKFEEELAENLEEQQGIKHLLQTPEAFDEELKKAYREVADKYGDERRTKISEVEYDKNFKEGGNLPVWVYSEGGSHFVTHSQLVADSHNDSFEVSEDDPLVWFTRSGRFGTISFKKLTEGELLVKDEILIKVVPKSSYKDAEYIIFESGEKIAACHISFIQTLGRGRAIIPGKYDLDSIAFSDKRVSGLSPLATLKVR